MVYCESRSKKLHQTFVFHSFFPRHSVPSVRARYVNNLCPGSVYLRGLYRVDLQVIDPEYLHDLHIRCIISTCLNKSCAKHISGNDINKDIFSSLRYLSLPTIFQTYIVLPPSFTRDRRFLPVCPAMISFNISIVITRE